MAPKDAHPPSILVVDDDDLFRTLMQRFLTPHYAVVTAANGAEALKAVEKERPGLILTDVAMPEMNGVEFLQKLRAREDTRDIPVIVLLATGIPEDVRLARSLAAAEILPKEEISWNLLLETVQRHVKR